MFAVVWSFGVSVDTPSRKPFDMAFRKVLLGDISSGKKKKNISIPDKGTLFDYKFKIKEEKLLFEWVKWTDQID